MPHERAAGTWARELRFAVQVSRPGLWLTAVWFYCLPAGQGDVLGTPAFWLGLFYVTFPMGYFVYGWNDAVDYDKLQDLSMANY